MRNITKHSKMNNTKNDPNELSIDRENVYFLWRLQVELTRLPLHRSSQKEVMELAKGGRGRNGESSGVGVFEKS